MLFLAVFCGFLAEYQLEHKIEKQRDKKFIQLLALNLQSDIDSIASIKVPGPSGTDRLIRCLPH